MSAPSARLTRRLRFGLGAGVVVASTTVSCVMVNLIAERLPARVDVTALRQHELAERTASLIATLDAPHEIVVAADWSAKDRRVADRVRDAVRRFDAASDRLDATLIDTGAARGMAEYDRLLSRLAERDAADIDPQREAIDAGAERLEALSGLFEDLAGSLEELAGALGGSSQAAAYFRRIAGAARNAVQEATSQAEGVRRALDTSDAPIAAPGVERAKARLGRALETADEDLVSLAENLGVIAQGEGVPEEARALAGRLEQTVRSHRDEVAIAAERVARLDTLDLARVSRALETGEAAIVIGPESVVGVDPRSLMPPGRWLDTERGARADVGRRAEELLASAIGSLASPAKPIVVVVHAQGRRFIDRWQGMRVVRERLQLHGVNFVEWPAAVDPDPPDLADLDPEGVRPVVYVAIGADTSAGSGERGTASGPERVEALGRALDRIIADGRPLLLSLWPSALPGYGLEDPTTRSLDAFGLEPVTGKPILRERFAEGERRVVAQQRLDAVESEHPLYAAQRGLPTTLSWPIGIRLVDPAQDASVERTPLFRISDADSWGESQWMALWLWQNAGPEGAGSRPEPPVRNEGRDWVEGPFTVGVAAERRVPGVPTTQRLVVVGSYDWFFDRWAGRASVIDERVVARNPGNAELFDAAVRWLAGQEELIARSPTARATARIEPIEPARLSVLRWSLVGGLPGLVLLLGALWWWLSR